MSAVYSKKKEKRPHSASSEANNSFVKNVTSRVSGLLPATITKWFSSPSSNTNGSAQTADATDSSTEDEAPESPITNQPPTKRMRFTSPGTYNQFGPSNTNCATTGEDTVDQCNAYTVQSPPTRTPFRRETNFVSTPLRSPSEDTTPDRTEKDSTMFKSQHSVSTVGSTVATKRKSLFDSPSASEASLRACAKTSANTMRDPSEPCFKPSLLGSPFYPGRTMYGGAAAYINQPNIQVRKNTLVKESKTNHDNTVSHSTRRIMDLLEQYSSPLNEAKRIAPYVYHTRHSPNSSSSENSSPYVNKVRSYKTQELHVPSLASILRLKQRSRLMDTTTAARQIIASHSSTTDYLPYIAGSAERDTTDDKYEKMTTKLKSRLTRLKRGEADLETDLPTPVNLPSAVLQIDLNNLPNFSFGTPKEQGPSSTSTPRSAPSDVDVASKVKESIPTNEITESPILKSKTVSSSYKFASPDWISSESSQMTTMPTKFTFGCPDRSIEKVHNNEMKVLVPSCVVGTSKPNTTITLTSEPKDWKCPDCWVNNKTDVEKCACCGGKKPLQNKGKATKCSVCKLVDSQSHVDKCVSCEIIKVNNVQTPAVDNTSKWECKDCWVRNNDTDEKCICCGANNPKKSGAANAGSSDTSDWKCDDCWVTNKSAAKACVSCGGSRPGANSAPGHGFTLFNTTKPPDGVKNIIKTQSNKWECTNCLVRNDTDKIKCVCCEAQRPGTMKESEKKSFNFGMNASSFKFGIDPKAQEAAKAEIKTTEQQPKVEESETNNNVLPKTPTFSFGVPAKKTEDKTDLAKKVEEKAGSAPKINFTFGVPASKPSATPTVTTIFGTPSKLTETTPKDSLEENEKLQEVPIINFGVQKTQEAPKQNSLNIFTPPSTLKDNVTSEAPPLMNAFKYTAENKESLPKSPLTLKPVVSLPDSTPKTNTFSFTGTGVGIKPAVNLFGSPSTTASTIAPPQTTTVTSNVTLFSKTEPTTTMSMFQKQDADKPTVSMFQKGDTQTTAAPPALGGAASFSFGSSTQITAPQAPQTEKPKFNFTFGSANKTDAPALFTTTFGVPSDNSSTNKFTLPTGNAVGAGTGANALTGNLLGGNDLNNYLSSSTLQTAPAPSTGLYLSSSTLQTAPAPSTGLFGSPVQKENMWSSNNNTTTNNLFVSNATTNSLQKPAAFSFGSQFSPSGTTTFGGAQPTPAGFGAQSTPPTFGSGVQSTPATFGSGAQSTPATFGSGAQSTPPTFGSGAQSTPATFGSGVQSTPATFGSGAQSTPATFGSGAQSTTSTFGSGQSTASNFGSVAQSTPVTFGSGAPTPATFGSGAQSTPVFGMGSQNTNSQPSLFSSPVQSPSAGGLFSQPASSPAPAMAMFGVPSAGATPTFGSPSAAIPPFEAPSLTPAPAPAFNFGAPSSTGIFGFGQQAHQQQAQQGGVYSFGGAAGAGTGVQFSMGSAPSAVRRVRKAVRKNTHR